MVARYKFIYELLCAVLAAVALKFAALFIDFIWLLQSVYSVIFISAMGLLPTVSDIALVNY